MMRAIFLIIAVIFFQSPALAGPIEDARGLFAEGEYDAAIDMSLALDTPEGLLLAAEVQSGKVMLQYVDDANDSAKQARKWAQKALKEMPNSQEAHVQLALAYGFETRTSSPFRAWRKNLPNKTRDAIALVREKYPDDPRGDALLGAWHLGIVRKAGAKNGKSWYEATEEDGVKYYEAAMTEAPGDIVIASNFVVTILALDTEKYYDRGVELLQGLPTMNAKTALEADVLKRIEGLIAFKDDKEALAAAVIEMVDGGIPE